MSNFSTLDIVAANAPGISRADLLDTLGWLRTIYPNVVGHILDDEGIAAWLADAYCRARQLGDTHQEAKDRVFAHIWAVVHGEHEPPWEVPTPPAPPAPAVTDTWPRLGASYYTSLTDPRVDPGAFAVRLQDAGCTYTRVWLIDAWAVGANGTGQYAGFMPWEWDVDSVFDLERVSQAYLSRLRTYVTAMNDHGILPQLTGWELYSWSDRKRGMLWVPDASRGPFQRNRQGVCYSDDAAFDVIATGGKHEFLGAFYAACVQALRGLVYTIELGNEMPEKPLHERLKRAWRDAGYTGSISVSRNTDAPGQYENMGIGGSYDRVSFHGKKSLDYLTAWFDDEPEYKTFNDFYASGEYEAHRIILSSDGCRKSTNVEDAYDYPRLTEVAKDALARGFSYEHQLACKLRTFRDGRFDLDDLRFDEPFLRSLR